MFYDLFGMTNIDDDALEAELTSNKGKYPKWLSLSLSSRPLST